MSKRKDKGIEKGEVTVKKIGYKYVHYFVGDEEGLLEISPDTIDRMKRAADMLPEDKGEKAQLLKDALKGCKRCPESLSILRDTLIKNYPLKIIERAFTKYGFSENAIRRYLLEYMDPFGEKVKQGKYE